MQWPPIVYATRRKLNKGTELPLTTSYPLFTWQFGARRRSRRPDDVVFFAEIIPPVRAARTSPSRWYVHASSPSLQLPSHLLDTWLSACVASSFLHRLATDKQSIKNPFFSDSSLDRPLLEGPQKARLLALSLSPPSRKRAKVAK